MKYQVEYWDICQYWKATGVEYSDKAAAIKKAEEKRIDFHPMRYRVVKIVRPQGKPEKRTVIG